MGGFGGRLERESQGLIFPQKHPDYIPALTPHQVHTHCYEAVDIDDFVRVRNTLSAFCFR